MSKIQNPPKRKKRFNVNVIKIVCGDCDAVMERWNEPYEPMEEHFYVKCPVCGMHIRAFKGSYHCIAENGRPYLEIKWDKDMEWKKKVLQTEKTIWEAKKKQQKEIDALNKAMEDEYKKDMEEARKSGKKEEL